MPSSSPSGSEPRDRPSVRWLVDAANVIGSRPDGWWNNPDKASRRFIDELDAFSRATGDAVTAVFDRRLPGIEPGRHRAITVAFASRHGPNAADHEIVRIVESDPVPGTLRVVTSDRRLAERVRGIGAAVTGSGTFRRQIDQAVGDFETE